MVILGGLVIGGLLGGGIGCYIYSNDTSVQAHNTQALTETPEQNPAEMKADSSAENQDINEEHKNEAVSDDSVETASGGETAPIVYEEDDYEDFDLEDYDEEERLSLPMLIRKEVLDEINSKKIVPIGTVLQLNDPDKMEQSILKSLKNNDCQTNSEDFVISSNDKFTVFQRQLSQIHYTVLYDAIYQKHLNNNSCKGNKVFTEWRMSSPDESTITDPETNELRSVISVYCDNGTFKDKNNYLDINLSTVVNYRIDKILHSFQATLNWSDFNDTHFKYLNGFEMDSHMRVGVDSKMASGENLIFDTLGALPFAVSTEHSRDGLMEAIRQGDNIHIAYGRFIFTKEDNNYFVLSFRTYSLKEMRENCPFLTKYHFHQDAPVPEVFSPIISPFKSKDDPNRIKKHVDYLRPNGLLPF